MYSRAGVTLPLSFVLETVVSAKTVGGAEGLLALPTRVFLQHLQWEENALIATTKIVGRMLKKFLVTKVVNIHLAMFTPHVSHKDLPGTEDTAAVSTCVS